MSRGRRTDREAYVLKEWDLPKPLPGAEWQVDKTFNLAEVLLRDPEKTVCGARKGCGDRNQARTVVAPVETMKFTTDNPIATLTRPRAG